MYQPADAAFIYFRLRDDETQASYRTPIFTDDRRGNTYPDWIDLAV